MIFMYTESTLKKKLRKYKTIKIRIDVFNYPETYYVSSNARRSVSHLNIHSRTLALFWKDVVAMIHCFWGSPRMRPQVEVCLCHWIFSVLEKCDPFWCHFLSLGLLFKMCHLGTCKYSRSTISSLLRKINSHKWCQCFVRVEKYKDILPWYWRRPNISSPVSSPREEISFYSCTLFFQVLLSEGEHCHYHNLKFGYGWTQFRCKQRCFMFVGMSGMIYSLCFNRVSL